MKIFLQKEKKPRSCIRLGYGYAYLQTHRAVPANFSPAYYFTIRIRLYMLWCFEMGVLQNFEFRTHSIMVRLRFKASLRVSFTLNHTQKIHVYSHSKSKPWFRIIILYSAIYTEYQRSHILVEVLRFSVTLILLEVSVNWICWQDQVPGSYEAALHNRSPLCDTRTWRGWLLENVIWKVTSTLNSAARISKITRRVTPVRSSNMCDRCDKQFKLEESLESAYWWKTVQLWSVWWTIQFQ